MLGSNILPKLDLLFKDFKIFTIKGAPLIKGCLSQPLMDEVYELVGESYKIKNNSLGFLKASINEVNDFSFTSPINSQIFNNGYLLPFLNYVGRYFLCKFKNKSIFKYGKDIYLLKYPHSIEGDWDIWINFATKFHKSTPHAHLGHMSGIIYIQNTENSPTCFKGGYKHYGHPGDIILFPSHLKHWVESVTSEKERITIAFNINDYNEQ